MAGDYTTIAFYFSPTAYIYPSTAPSAQHKSSTMVSTVTSLVNEVASKLSLTDKPKQPDIAYHPDRANWEARTARRLAQDPSLPKTSLPDGFTSRLESPLVWKGSDWKDENQWVFQLTEEHLREIDDAVTHFKSLDVPWGKLSPSTFPLATLGPILREQSKEIYSGRGFFVLRTIPVDKYTREDVVIIYAGVSSWVGTLRGVQDPNGAVLAHIKDLSQTAHEKTIGAPAYTTDKQVFHTDAGDIIALFALQVAAEGGISRISSSWRVYNELAEKRPDLIKTLSEPWIADTFGADPPYRSRPLLFSQDGKVIIQYARRLFTGFLHLPRSSDIPPITEAQAEALDTLHFLAEEHALGLNFQKGDIQFINNLSIFHGRDGFKDDGEKSRHLLRLWLRDEELSWKTPEGLKEQWKKLYYTTKPEEQTFPLEPYVRGPSFAGNTKGTQSTY